MQAKKDNVLNFPSRKPETVATSQPLPPALPEPQQPTEQSKKSSKKKSIGALGAILAMSLLANRYSPSNSTDLASTSGGRGIASVGDHAILPEERDVNWEKSLASELGKRTQRELASLTLGQRPNDEERLRFGTLKSQYAVIMENGKLSEIRTSAADGSVYLGDGETFLKQNQNLMPVKFATAISESREANSEGIHQTYALFDENQARVGSANFGMDRYGRLIKFNVTSATSVE